MSDLLPDEGHRLSPALRSDLETLHRDHAINPELIKSLIASKSEARAHIGFFKRMMFVTNGLVMTAGLSLAGFGGQRLLGGFSIVGLVCLIMGGLIFLKFMSVFVSMTKAIKATEAVAHRHSLI